MAIAASPTPWGDDAAQQTGERRPAGAGRQITRMSFTAGDTPLSTAREKAPTRPTKAHGQNPNHVRAPGASLDCGDHHAITASPAHIMPARLMLGLARVASSLL
jgi:hypothetical protein